MKSLLALTLVSALLLAGCGEKEDAPVGLAPNEKAALEKGATGTGIPAEAQKAIEERRGGGPSVEGRAAGSK